NVTGQTPSSMSGTFSATCPGDVIVTGQASGQLGNPAAIPITVTGTAVLGNDVCPFALSGTGALDSAGTTLTIPYTGTTCLGPVTGTQVLRRAAPAPAPAPEPLPLPPPQPVPQPGSTDAIDP